MSHLPIIPPYGVQQSALDLRKMEIVNEEKEKMQSETQMLNSILASLNLPAALENTSGHSLPPSLREKAAAIKEKGGVEAVESRIQKLLAMLQRNKEILDECERRLKDAEDSDMDLRTKFGTQWGRLKADLSKYRQIIAKATSADQVVRKKYAKHKDKIALLCLPEDQLLSFIPEGSPVASCSSVDKLKGLMRQVEQLKYERENLMGELDRAFLDVGADALSSVGWLNELALSVKAGPIQKRIQENIQRQEALVKDIQLANSEFCKEKNSSGGASKREGLLCVLAAAHDAYMELLGNIQEGSDFYQDLTEALLRFQNNIRYLFFARKTEEEDHCKDLQEDIVTQANQPSTLEPPQYHNTTGMPPSNFGKPMIRYCVIIRVWLCKEDGGADVGHATLQTPNEYLSLWPSRPSEKKTRAGMIFEHRPGAYFCESYEEDLELEERPPEFTCCLYSLNIFKLDAKIREIKSETKQWSVAGNTKVGNKSRETSRSCSGAAYECLLAGDMTELADPGKKTGFMTSPHNVFTWARKAKEVEMKMYPETKDYDLSQGFEYDPLPHIATNAIVQALVGSS